MLSTLVSALVAQGQSVDDATVLVNQAFGLDPSLDILNIDPIASTLAGDPSGETFFANIGLVQNTVVQISSLLEGTGDTSFESASDAAFDQLATLILTGPFDLSDQGTIEALIQEVAPSVGVSDTAVDTIASGAAAVIAETNGAVQEVVEGASTGELLLT